MMKLEDIKVGKTYTVHTTYEYAPGIIVPKGTKLTITSITNGKAWTKFRGMLMAVKLTKIR